MGIKASNQITLIDLTDGYSVILTNENHTFLGSTDSVLGTQTTTCMIQALCGTEQVDCSIGTITAPTGLTIVSDNKTPIPTLTITATSELKQSGSVTLPVQIGDITISKIFSYSIAFKGANGSNGTSVTIKSTQVSYQASNSGVDAPTGTWVTSIPSVSAGQYLWTRTIVEYSDGKSTTSYSVSRNGSNGANGTSVSITKTEVSYQVSTSGVDTPTGTWVTTIPTVPAGQYLWTKTVVTYSDGKSTTSFSISRNGTNGTNGANGQDALTLIVSSSNGFIFKNTDIATTLSAKVFKGGSEVTGSTLTSLGTIKWYKDGETTAMATGSTLTINAGDVDNHANLTAHLED